MTWQAGLTMGTVKRARLVSAPAARTARASGARAAGQVLCTAREGVLLGTVRDLALKLCPGLAIEVGPHRPSPRKRGGRAWAARAE